MGSFFNNLNDKMGSFMVGRNGTDRLGRWALTVAVIFMVINLLVPNIICSVISYALLFYCIYRMFSRNVSARQAEEEKFDAFLSRFKRGSGSASQKTSKPQRTSDPMKVVFTCDKCGQSLSVPKGRGTLKVTCPKCGHQQKKTT